MKIELFNITYRPGLADAPVSLICQALDVNAEKFLWVDGLDPDEPVLISLASCIHVEWLGSFDEITKGFEEIAMSVLRADQGEHSPTILARAITYMRHDPSLGGAGALSLAVEQAQSIIAADKRCEAELDALVEAG